MMSSKRNFKILGWLLSHQNQINTDKLESVHDWKRLFDEYSNEWIDPVDRAIIGGFISDRLGYAFAAGYQSALRFLVPAIPLQAVAALCISEKEGGHPKNIHTELRKIEEGSDPHWLLNGRKQFVTMIDNAEIFFVVASTGKNAEGINQLKLLQLERSTPGLTCELMDKLPFIPEINHGVLHLKDVTLSESQMLPGDGYIKYIKPFRTIEDLHIFAAFFGYLFRIGCQYNWPRNIKEQIISQLSCIISLAQDDPSAKEIHIAVGGMQKQVDNLLQIITPYWVRVDVDVRINWERDRAILKVANNARIKRLEKAWSYYAV